MRAPLQYLRAFFENQLLSCGPGVLEGWSMKFLFVARFGGIVNRLNPSGRRYAHMYGTGYCCLSAGWQQGVFPTNTSNTSILAQGAISRPLVDLPLAQDPTPAPVATEAAPTSLKTPVPSSLAPPATATPGPTPADPTPDPLDQPTTAPMAETETEQPVSTPAPSPLGLPATVVPSPLEMGPTPAPLDQPIAAPAAETKPPAATPAPTPLTVSKLTLLVLLSRVVEPSD